MRRYCQPLLLIEDDDAIRDALQTWLGLEGYDVVAASDGGAAVALVEEGHCRPALVIADQNLPGKLSGVDATAAAQWPRHRTIGRDGDHRGRAARAVGRDRPLGPAASAQAGRCRRVALVHTLVGARVTGSGAALTSAWAARSADRTRARRLAPGRGRAHQPAGRRPAGDQHAAGGPSRPGTAEAGWAGLGGELTVQGRHERPWPPMRLTADARQPPSRRESARASFDRGRPATPAPARSAGRSRLRRSGIEPRRRPVPGRASPGCYGRLAPREQIIDEQLGGHRVGGRTAVTTTRDIHKV